MDSMIDFALEQANGTPTLLVEVKGKRGTSADWATEYRRNLAEHSFLVPSSYFLLALPDRFYFWHPDTTDPGAAPDHVEDAEPLLRPYLEQVGELRDALSESGWETVVSWWLTELTKNPDRSRVPAWLSTSGLLNALHGARLRQCDG